VAKHWVKNDGRVVLADVVLESLQRLEEEIQEMGGEVAVIACDVTKEDDNHASAHVAVERFGAINLVVPGAGITKDSVMLYVDRNTGKVTKKMSLEQFQSVMDIWLKKRKDIGIGFVGVKATHIKSW